MGYFFNILANRSVELGIIVAAQGVTGGFCVPDEIVDRFCVLGPAQAHIEKLSRLQEIGVDQFAVYLQHDDMEHTLAVYGDTVIPALSWAPFEEVPQSGGGDHIDACA